MTLDLERIGQWLMIAGVWLIGVHDGVMQPHDLTYGRTYNGSVTPLSRAYDGGATVGQRLGRVLSV